MATISAQLAATVATTIQREPHPSRYAWPVKGRVWALLGTDFDHAAFGEDSAAQNIALKNHLSEYWPKQKYEEKLRLASWIVRDWGGIKRNSPTTIASYVDKADAERPATPLKGVASYSKVLAMKQPDRFAIYDARTAASILAIQLLNREQLRDGDRLLFPIPPGQNSTIAGNEYEEGFVEMFPKTALVQEGFTPVSSDAAYSLYLGLLTAIAAITRNTILETEMFLFASAPALCRRAMETRRPQ